ncbi:MAG: hypothetical protein WCR24_04755 [Candidatus Methanomethylophilaceae archaeon]
MGYDIETDVLKYLETQGIGTFGRTLIRDVTSEIRQSKTSWVTLKGVSSSLTPEPLSDTDFSQFNVEVCGGSSESGTTRGGQLAFSVYKALSLVLDHTEDDTDYLCIENLGSPFPSIQNGLTIYTWQIKVTRYYGGMT